MNDLEQADMLQVLVNEIADTVSNAKREFAEKVNSVMTETYWTIGKYIVEFEQDGNVKAEYGSQLLTKLSHQLTLRLGKVIAVLTLITCVNFICVIQIVSRCLTN